MEDLRGIGIVVFITLLAGAIAYAGDRVGHQIGRKRLTLYNIRPRYTSTIIAVGTGMLIALVVTLAAIFASSEVRAAFFQLSTINEQIDDLKAREAALVAKVNNAQIVVPVAIALSPTVAKFPQNSTPELRYKIAQDFYNGTVAYANRTFAPRLKKYAAPPNLDALLHELAEAPQVVQPNKNADIYVVAIADHNLFAGDRIDFSLRTFPDVLYVHSGAELARGTILGGPTVNLALVIQQLQSHVIDQLVRSGLPPYFAGTPYPVQYLPSQREMQRVLATGAGTYAISAFAAEDIYPHTFLTRGFVPIVVVATPLK
jgi:hypothetical protein